MQSTRVVLGRGSVSTHHGQRRILKHSTPDVVTYIQKAVKAGVYRSNEEIRKMNEKLEENPMELSRIRWNVLRGSKIHNYPKEYEILTLNPPDPFVPRVPAKDRRKALNKYVKERRPTDRLAQKYLNSQMTTDNEETSAEEYYRRLLGSNRTPKIDSAMGSKSALLNKAYAVAVKQYHLMRTENLSEVDAMEAVDELLKTEDVVEQTTSRSRAENVASNKATKSMDVSERAQRIFPKPSPQNKDKQGDKDDSDVAMLYSDNHKAFEGMISWTRRLQAVPYRQWTVGASTALDHWIAKRVLGLSEHTWLMLVEGNSPELIGRGRDIVMARHALFPETILDGDPDLNPDEISADREGDDSTDDFVSDDLDALLATLGGWDSNDGDNNDDNDPSSNYFEQTGVDSDDKILALTTELQNWRKKNMDLSYDDWSNDDKMTFKAWLQDYVATLVPASSLGKVDMEETRKSLLSSPPQSKETSDTFWDNIRDETSAEVFLQQLLSEKRLTDANADVETTAMTDSHPFWQLEYRQQLECLVNLGTIRELVDEYTGEGDRDKFIARYGDYLLEGMHMEHLVPDPNGPIRGTDLGERLLKHYNIGRNERFRLEKIAYGSDQFGNDDASVRAREISREWNKLKAGRAHYEERLFQRGLLGLTYAQEKKE